MTPGTITIVSMVIKKMNFIYFLAPFCSSHMTTCLPHLLQLKGLGVMEPAEDAQWLTLYHELSKLLCRQHGSCTFQPNCGGVDGMAAESDNGFTGTLCLL